jgi:hypothetical protein
LKGLYWRTNSAQNTALTEDDWKRVYCEERITPTTQTAKTRNILHLYGSTVGNTASELVSGTAGVLSYGDAGPQINFSTAATIGSTQDSAIIWTDNDVAAGTNSVSWHFVSKEDDWNVISKRFHARTGISIGTDLPQKSYNLYVNGTTFHSESITFGTASSIVPGSAIDIYTRSYSTYSTAVKWSNGDTWGTRGAEIGYHNTGGDSTNPGTICILPYQTDSNPWDGQVGLFIKKDHVYIDGVELSKTDSKVTQTATTTDANYEVLFSATADNTTRTETARKNSNLKFNPSTGMLSAGKLTLTSSTWVGLTINRTTASSHAGILFQQNGTDLGSISMGEVDSPLIRWKGNTAYKVYDEGHVQPMLWRYTTESDPSTATDAGVYPNYTMAYMQGAGAFGGDVGRLGNTGSNYWAHFLTFTHNDKFRYILRFPFWGPPQFQRTTNDVDQKWSNFITDEHIGNYSRYMGTGTAIDPVTGAMTHMHRANKLAFLPAANVTVQISNDSGSTWSNLGVTDTLKRQIFSLPGRSSSIKIGPSSGNATTAMQTRVIIECDGRDVVLNRFLFGIGSDYHNIAIDVYAGSTINGLTKLATGDASSTWAYEAVVTIDQIPTKYYRFSTSNYKYFAFVFRYTYVNPSYLTHRGTINGIYGYSGNYWGNDCKSNLANYDHLYSWDIDQNASFPSDIYASGTVRGEELALNDNSTYTTTIQKGSTSANRTIILPNASGALGIANILFNEPSNSTNPVPVSVSLSDYDYFTIVFSMNGSDARQSSSAIVPAIAGSHYFLFQVLESVGSGGSMMFPAGVIISQGTSTISFNIGVNRGLSIPSSGSTMSVVSARSAYIKMIIGHKS